MWILIHRILNVRNSDGYYEENWVVSINDDYETTEKQLTKELEEYQTINHYCMHEINQEIFCKGSFDGHRYLGDTYKLIVNIINQILNTKNLDDSAGVFHNDTKLKKKVTSKMARISQLFNEIRLDINEFNS